MARILGHAEGDVVMPDLSVVRFGLATPHRFHDERLAEMARASDAVKATMALTYLPASSASSMLAQVTTTGLFISIHTASPGTTGASEITPATGYTGNRPGVTWAAFNTSTGAVVSSNTQTYALLSIQAGGIPYFGIWTGTTAGTYLGGGTTSGLSGSIPSGANVTFTSAITLTQAG